MLRAIPPILTLCVLLVGHAFAATSYTYVTVEPKPEWNAIHLFLHGMDDLGKMVGNTVDANGNGRPWRYVPGIQPSPMMRWNQGAHPTNNSVWDINNRGWLVQVTFEGVGDQVSYCKPSPCVKLPISTYDPNAARITNSAHVVGSYTVSAGDHEPGRESYIFDLLTNKKQIVTYPERRNTYLTSMNDDGMATGFAFNDVFNGTPEEIQYVSFTYQDGQFYPFSIPGTLSNQLTAVNNRGTLAGIAHYEHDMLAFVLHPSGELLEISFPDSVSTFVATVNNRGVIGGSYMRADGTERGFVAWPQVVAEPAVAALGMSSAAALETHQPETPDGITEEAQPLRENFRMDEKLRSQVCAGGFHQYGRVLPGCPR